MVCSTIAVIYDSYHQSYYGKSVDEYVPSYGSSPKHPKLLGYQCINCVYQWIVWDGFSYGSSKLPKLFGDINGLFVMDDLGLTWFESTRYIGRSTMDRLLSGKWSSWNHASLVQVWGNTTTGTASALATWSHK